MEKQYFRSIERTGSEDVIVRVQDGKYAVISALYFDEWETSEYFEPDLENDFYEIEESQISGIVDSWKAKK